MSTKHGDNSGADLVEEALDLQKEPEALAVPEKGFKPWHKPRKHFVRLRQWSDEVKALITDLSRMRAGALPERLRYLTLPGDELLDIRVLHDACAEKKVRLRYLGFNTPEGGVRRLESELSQAKVQRAQIPPCSPRVRKEQSNIDHLGI